MTSFVDELGITIPQQPRQPRKMFTEAETVLLNCRVDVRVDQIGQCTYRGEMLDARCVEEAHSVVDEVAAQQDAQR